MYLRRAPAVVLLSLVLACGKTESGNPGSDKAESTTTESDKGGPDKGGGVVGGAEKPGDVLAVAAAGDAGMLTVVRPAERPLMMAYTYQKMLALHMSLASDFAAGPRPPEDVAKEIATLLEGNDEMFAAMDGIVPGLRARASSGDFSTVEAFVRLAEGISIEQAEKMQAAFIAAADRSRAGGADLRKPAAPPVDRVDEQGNRALVYIRGAREPGVVVRENGRWYLDVRAFLAGNLAG